MHFVTRWKWRYPFSIPIANACAMYMHFAKYSRSILVRELAYSNYACGPPKSSNVVSMLACGSVRVSICVCVLAKTREIEQTPLGHTSNAVSFQHHTAPTVGAAPNKMLFTMLAFTSTHVQKHT